MKNRTQIEHEYVIARLRYRYGHPDPAKINPTFRLATLYGVLYWVTGLAGLVIAMATHALWAAFAIPLSLLFVFRYYRALEEYNWHCAGDA